MSKLRTSGVSETKLIAFGHHFTIIDVGGQRCERRKWVHCFEGVSAVIYLVALDSYNMTLDEDNKTNRLEDSLKVFTEVVGSPWFKDHLCLLLFNKIDLLEQKIAVDPLSNYYSDITPQDSQNVDIAVDYIQQKFVTALPHQKFFFVTQHVQQTRIVVTKYLTQ